MPIGLDRRLVKLVPWSPEWITLFEDEKARIAECLGREDVRIEHVGSTAVGGLPAKPILDIAIGVSDAGRIPRLIEQLKRIGYDYRGTVGHEGDHVLAKGPPSNRTHYVHVTEIGSEEWNNLILFRDCLRRDREKRAEYARLKGELAREHSSDWGTYTEGKAAFIRRVVAMDQTREERQQDHSASLDAM